MGNEISESEECLHHRIYILEQTVEWLKEKTLELVENNNTIVSELSKVIELLNDKCIDNIAKTF